MSTKLDAIAYQKMPELERRVERLERIVLTLERIERGCHIFPEKKQEYFALIKQLTEERIEL